MALTINQPRRASATGSMKTVHLEITPDDSWLAAGEVLDLTQYVPVIESVVLDGGATGYVWQYDHANKKLLAFEAGADGAALDAVADATNLSSHTVRITVSGRRA
tara:strand:- start:944 stop:1258 length:315 start_codon:yes stop_codon:yes gene_type:complete